MEKQEEKVTTESTEAAERAEQEDRATTENTEATERAGQESATDCTDRTDREEKPPTGLEAVATDPTDGTDQEALTTEVTETTERTAELKKENARLRAEIARARIEQELVGAATAQDAVNAAQVAALMRDRVRADDDLRPMVVDEYGNRAMDEDGRPVTVADAVRAFLDENAHLQRPTKDAEVQEPATDRTDGTDQEVGLTTSSFAKASEDRGESTEKAEGGRMKQEVLTTEDTESTERDERLGAAAGRTRGRRGRLDSGLTALTGRTPALTGGELIAEALREGA